MSSVWAEDAEQAVDEALALLRAVEAGAWEKAGAPGHGLYDPSMRPIDDLTRNGVGWLEPYVQDLQAVVDRLAGNAAVIQHFAAAWRDRATKVEQSHTTLADRVKADTEQWKGDTADVYRRRAEEIRLAFEAAAYVSKVNAELGAAVGTIVATARGQARDQLAELVTQLSNYAKLATSMEQGVTPNVMNGCLELIASYRPAIVGIEEQVLQKLGVDQANASTPAGSGGGSGGGPGTPRTMAKNTNKVWGQLRSALARRGTERYRKEVDRAWRQRDREKERQEGKDWSKHKQQNYRGGQYAEDLKNVYGPPPQDGRIYQAHHNFPVKFGVQFEKMGIKTNNAAWGTWLEVNFHRQITAKFEADWAAFFAARPNLSTADAPAATAYLRKLAIAHNYKLPF